MNNYSNIHPNMRVLVKELSPYYEKRGMTKEEAKEEIIRDFMNNLHSNEGRKVFEVIRKKIKKQDLAEKKFIDIYIQAQKALENMKNTQNNENNENSSTVNKNDPHSILGVSKNASKSEIRKAYLKKSISGNYRHPNKGGDAEEFKKLQAAYEMLSGSSGGRRKTRRSYKRKGTRKMRR